MQKHFLLTIIGLCLGLAAPCLIDMHSGHSAFAEQVSTKSKSVPAEARVAQAQGSSAFTTDNRLAPLTPAPQANSPEREVSRMMRYSTPLAPLFAALIAAPLGMMFARKGAYAGVGISIILVFLYYVLTQMFHALGNHGAVPPLFAAWTPNILFGAVGAVLIWLADRR